MVTLMGRATGKQEETELTFSLPTIRTQLREAVGGRFQRGAIQGNRAP
jgi:hypothetical protein